MAEPSLDELTAWGRYLMWCEDHYRRYDEMMARDPTNDSVADYAWFVARTSHWYASLWVVVEGWQELGLRDNIVDGLLRNGGALCGLFRRFHSAVYHYRRDLYDADLMVLFHEGEAAQSWAHALRSEFRRFLWEWPARSAVNRSAAKLLRDHLREVLGWFPDDCITAKIDDADNTAEEVERLYSAARARGDPEADEMRKAAADFREAAHQTRKNYLGRQQEYFAKRWLEPRDLGG